MCAAASEARLSYSLFDTEVVRLSWALAEAADAAAAVAASSRGRAAVSATLDGVRSTVEAVRRIGPRELRRRDRGYGGAGRNREGGGRARRV